ncbi:MAG: NADPH2:quinone reductase [Flavobacteriales bacterium]|jgi:NADPH2:quinone reductase
MKMNAINISQFGGPEVLELFETARPEPGANEVLIKVAAAGVNRPDTIQRMGFYPAPAGASEILGLEVSGVIEKIGSGVDSVNIGDEVCALLGGGGYAEYAIAHIGLCLPVPKGLTLIEAAALPETSFTVWSNVFDRADLKAGQTLLVHGASGGIGIMAMQLASLKGARVIATAGSDDKCGACEKLGADKAVNYHNEDFVQVVKELTNNQGANVILDIVGGPYIEKNIAACADDGTIVSIGFLQGSIAEVNFMPVMLKRLTLTGSTLRPRPVEFKAAIAKQLVSEVWPLIEQGKLNPSVGVTLPLADAAKAHQMMETNQHIGKIVLIP